MFISIILLYDGIIVLTMYVKYVNTDHICNMLCFRRSAYVVKADVMPMILADVIAIFSCFILLHVGQMLGPYMLFYITG